MLILELARRLQGNRDARHDATLQAPALPPPCTVPPAHGVDVDANEVAPNDHGALNVAHDGGAYCGLVGGCDGAVEDDLHDDRALVSTSGRCRRC